jgi:hypothetical protein
MGLNTSSFEVLDNEYMDKIEIAETISPVDDELKKLFDRVKTCPFIEIRPAENQILIFLPFYKIGGTKLRSADWNGCCAVIKIIEYQTDPTKEEQIEALRKAFDFIDNKLIPKIKSIFVGL